MSTLELIAAERRSIADEFSKLSREQLAVPSLCGAWTVHDIAAHLYGPLVVSRATILRLLVLSRGNFDDLNERLTALYARQPIDQLAEGLRAEAENRFRPPGYPYESPLTDLVIHGEDFRRPLGLEHDHDPAALKAALEFIVSPRAKKVFRSGRSLDGLKLYAQDLDWTFGAGAPVEGRAIDLILGLAGRRVALAGLSGEGVAALG